MSGTQNDKDIGMLIAGFDALKGNQDKTSKVLDEIYKEIEKLSQQFTDYKAAHDSQSLKDYKYLDIKIDESREEVRKEHEKLAHRINKIEHEREIEKAAEEAARKVSEENKLTKEKSVGKKLTDSVVDAFGKILAGAIVAIFLGVLGIYFANGGKWPW